MKSCFIFALLLLPVALWPGGSAHSSIRQIDFKNFTYAWDDAQDHSDTSWRWLDSSPESHIKVSDGVYRFDDQSEGEGEPPPFLSVDSVTYGDLTGDGIDEALVKLNYSTGGTSNWDYLYVYTLRNGHLFLLGRLESGTRGYGGLIKVSVSGTSLVLDFADKDKLRGECCSAGYIRVHYRLQRGTFVEFGTRTYGDKELREGPKGKYKWEEPEKE